MRWRRTPFQGVLRSLKLPKRHSSSRSCPNPPQQNTLSNSQRRGRWQATSGKLELRSWAARSRSHYSPRTQPDSWSSDGASLSEPLASEYELTRPRNAQYHAYTMVKNGQTVRSYNSKNTKLEVLFIHSLQFFFFFFLKKWSEQLRYM